MFVSYFISFSIVVSSWKACFVEESDSVYQLLSDWSSLRVDWLAIKQSTTTLVMNVYRCLVLLVVLSCQHDDAFCWSRSLFQ